MAKNWIEFRNKTSESADLYIYNEIGFWGTLATDIRKELRDLDTKQINLHLNSPGGAVFEGNAIYNMLRQHKAKVVVYIDGIAASIASVIAMAGDEIIIADNAMIMIHDPIGGVYGTAEEARKMADVLDKVKDTIVAAYTRKTGKDTTEIAQLMADETWFTAFEAVAMGFADAISEPIQAAARFNLGGFRNAPESIRLTAKTSGKGEVPKPKIDNMKEIITSVSNAFAGDSFKANAIELAAQGKDLGDIIAAYVNATAKREADIAAQHEKAIADLTAKHEQDVKATADDLATAKRELAEVNAKLEAGGTDTSNGKSFLDQYNAITDPAAKTDFFRANKNALMAEARKQGN